MRVRQLGQSGLFVSELCLGTMTFGGSEGMWGEIGRLRQEEADALVKTAIDAGHRTQLSFRPRWISIR